MSAGKVTEDYFLNQVIILLGTAKGGRMDARGQDGTDAEKINEISIHPQFKALILRSLTIT